MPSIGNKGPDVFKRLGKTFSGHDVVGFFGKPQGMETLIVGLGGKETLGAAAKLHESGFKTRGGRAAGGGLTVKDTTNIGRKEGVSPRPRARKALTAARGLASRKCPYQLLGL